MPARKTDRLVTLVGLAYACVEAPERWGRFVSELSTELDDAAVSLYLDNDRRHRRTRIFNAGFVPDDRLFEERLLDRGSGSPWRSAFFTAPVGRVCVHRTPSRAEVERSEFYRDVLVPSGVGSGPLVTLVFERSGKRLDGSLTVTPRLEGRPLGKSDIELLEALAPHILRARELCFLIDRGRAYHSGLSEVVDRLHLGVILLDEDGRAVFANPSAGELCGVRETDSHAARIDGINRFFAAGLGLPSQQLIQNGLGVGTLQHPVDGAPIQMIVSTLERPATVLGNKVPAAIFLADPRRSAGEPVAVLRALYQLAPSEAALVVLLVSGQSLKQAAARLGVTENTARTRLGKIFEKTGAHTQAGLTRLVIAGPGQLRSVDAALPGPSERPGTPGSSRKKRAR
jgi:DNA-binding CsgD family transcriptional regulator